MKKIVILKPREWEAEAVDFFCVEIEKCSKAELLKYAKGACDFIAKTMHRMELRPKRSLARELKIRRCYVCNEPFGEGSMDWKFGPSCGKPQGHTAIVCRSCAWGADMFLTRQRAARLRPDKLKSKRSLLLELKNK